MLSRAILILVLVLVVMWLLGGLLRDSRRR
jgi:hypothetical protein